MQGLFGAVSVPEKLIQQVWARGDFRRDALRTVSRRSLEIVTAGTWNRLDGPDFIGAEMLLDGRAKKGDRISAELSEDGIILSAHTK